MAGFSGLRALRERGTVIITGHRGFPAEYPENTLLSEESAIQSGADLIEFDLRLTADRIPVVLHDETIDRTSDGHGRPEDFTLEQLRKFNFSCPRRGMGFPVQHIPTFEEMLQRFRGRAGMNIQIYVGGKGPGLDEVCRLYCRYEMFDQGYLTIADDATAAAVRSFDPRIEICLTPGWHERAARENLEKCAAFGCRFVQPTAESVTAETFELCRELGLTANVFFADTEAEFQRLCGLGASGIMTNRPPALSAWLKTQQV